MPRYSNAVAFGFAALLGTGQAAMAADTSTMTLIPGAAAIQWQAAPASLPKGTKISILAGDPAKPGPFVLRLLFPANTDILPHTHNTAENVTVLSGSIFHEMGVKLDKGRGEQLTIGGFVYLPGEMPHSLWTTAEAAELQVTGTGPFGLNYVNPSDDPSRTR